MAARLALLAGLALACARTIPDRVEESVAEATHWEVYDGTDLILTVEDGPGVIRSTAPLPPGTPPATHPFLSARAHSAMHEHQLRALLETSESTSQFLERLREEGFDVRAR